MNNFIFLFLIIILVSCKSEDTVMEEEVFPFCNEIDTIAEKQFIDIDSIHRVYIPSIAEPTIITSMEKSHPISIQNSFFAVYLGFCDESIIIDDFPLCYNFSLFNYDIFIEKEFPDSVTRIDRNPPIVLDNLVRFCKNNETVGVLYWRKHSNGFTGRLYYSDFSSDEYFYLVGRLGSIEDNGIDRLIKIVDQIEIIRI